MMFGSKREEDFHLDEISYLEKRLERASLLCHRFPTGIDFRDKDILDIGSGFGAFSIHAARQGARTVLGIDPDPESVSTAQRLVHQLAPDTSGTVTFRNTVIEELGEGAFDLAVSMAVFEHVQNPTSTLRALRRNLRRGGLAFLGIGPLYRAPWGDHRRTKAPLQTVFPWAHLAFPEQWLIARHNRRHPEHPALSIRDLGLNCLRLDDYWSACEASGMNIEWFATNVTENSPVSTLLNLGMRLPGCRDLLAVNTYIVLSNG